MKPGLTITETYTKKYDITTTKECHTTIHMCDVTVKHILLIDFKYIKLKKVCNKINVLNINDKGTNIQLSQQNQAAF